MKDNEKLAKSESYMYDSMRNILSPCKVINQDGKEKKRRKHVTFITFFIVCLIDKDFISIVYMAWNILHVGLQQVTDCGRPSLCHFYVGIFSWLKGYYYYERASPFETLK